MWKELALMVIAAATALAATDKLVCYHGSWANYRNGNCRYTVENINASICTHIIYGFVGITNTGGIRIMDSWLEEDDGLGGLRRFTSRAKNNGIKSLIAIGGWNEGSEVFSKIASSATLRADLIKNSIAFLQKYGFDGFDWDWEYPAQRGGAATDKANFSKLLAEFRAAFDKYGYLLTAAVAAAEGSVDLSYEVPQLSKYLDFINIMAYDLHGAWESVTGHNAPLYPLSTETGTARTLNVDACINGWINRGADPKKLILGVGTYGRTFTLSNTKTTGLGAPASGGGSSGQCTGEMGILGYNEICQKLAAGGWTTVWNDEQQVPYAYNGNQWIGYDNERSIILKAEYAKAKGLGGVMVWSVETDDFKGLCGKVDILLNAIKTTLKLPSPSTTTTTTTTTTPGSTTTTQKATSTTTTTTTTPKTTTTTKATTTTAKPTTTSTTPSSGGATVCSASGYVRDSKDCGIFYQCVQNGANYAQYKFVCPSGLYFDPSIAACNYPSQVSC